MTDNEIRALFWALWWAMLDIRRGGDGVEAMRRHQEALEKGAFER